MAERSKLCRYLHIPLQSGHDDTLARMQRKYTVEEFSNFVQRAHTMVPGICIGTDIIVGFPGETEAQFEATAELVRVLPLHYFHIFSYSQRSLAKSRLLGDAISPASITKRSQILRDLSLRKRRLFYEQFLDTNQNVLFENQKNGEWIGLTDNYIRVKFKSEKNLENQICNVKLNKISGQFVLATHEASKNS
jgi:threonylcarbamoyladenosine tRNA methylthiotransferase MtaB